MVWIFDPTIWVGLITLIIIEVVLGIDNLIFIVILTGKLPSHEQDKARVLGLFLAMLTRLGLLTIVSWLFTLSKPLINIGFFVLSGRDLILLFGGLFLIFKATLELHERLEITSASKEASNYYASFTIVVTQVVVLDTIFSVDSVITAVGMVDHLLIMMMAIIASIGIMLLASKPLSEFVNNHQTVIVLCLSFLLMIGFSLVAEGLGFKIPKGYLYSAIGFSILIEFFNQMARRNLLKEQSLTFRERTAATILNMLSGKPPPQTENITQDLTNTPKVFFEEERKLIRGVLTLAEKKIRSIMTPRFDITWININSNLKSIKKQLLETPHSFVLVCRDYLDDVIGIARTKDLMADILEQEKINAESTIKKPIILQENWQAIKTIKTLKKSKGHLLVVLNNQGEIRGVISSLDLLEAIAGEFPDEDEKSSIQHIRKDKWVVDANIELYLLEQELETELFTEEKNNYLTLAHLLWEKFKKRPQIGDSVREAGYVFTIAQLKHKQITKVNIRKIDSEI